MDHHSRDVHAACATADLKRKPNCRADTKPCGNCREDLFRFAACEGDPKIGQKLFEKEQPNALHTDIHRGENGKTFFHEKELFAYLAVSAGCILLGSLLTLKKAKDTVRNKEEKKRKALKFDSKLADCYSKNRSKCEIYVTEGDSASGNLKTARDNEFQAVMPVRGKILNTQKATLDKIQKNAEIMTLIDAFGLTIDPKTMKITYNKEDLRYGKIIIMSDADVSNTAYERLFA